MPRKQKWAQHGRTCCGFYYICFCCPKDRVTCSGKTWIYQHSSINNCHCLMYRLFIYLLFDWKSMLLLHLLKHGLWSLAAQEPALVCFMLDFVIEVISSHGLRAAPYSEMPEMQKWICPIQPSNNPDKSLLDCFVWLIVHKILKSCSIVWQVIIGPLNTAEIVVPIKADCLQVIISHVNIIIIFFCDGRLALLDYYGFIFPDYASAWAAEKCGVHSNSRKWLYLELWKAVKKNVHHQMYIMSKQNPAFDQPDKGKRRAEQFKAAGHTKYLQYKVAQLICVSIIQQLNFKIHCASFVVASQ